MLLPMYWSGYNTCLYGMWRWGVLHVGRCWGVVCMCVLVLSSCVYAGKTCVCKNSVYAEKTPPHIYTKNTQQHLCTPKTPNREDPLATLLFVGMLALASAAIAVFGTPICATFALFWLIRPPVLRDPLPPTPLNIFQRLPTEGDRIA